MKNIHYTCAVCGWRHLLAPQRSSSGGASHEVCPSCGFESGYTDDDQGFSYETWRERWVSAGLPWSSKGCPKPKLWNPMQDLHALIKRKRPVIPLIRLQRASALADRASANIPAAKKLPGRPKRRDS